MSNFFFTISADWETDRWMLKPNFADFTGKLDFSDAKEQEKTSRELSEYIRKKAFREIMGISNASGIVMFTNLEQGIYLVAQEQSFRYDIYTYTSTPSLVQVPARIGDQDYLDVELEMKFARTEDEPETTGPTEPETTDRQSQGNNRSEKPETSRTDMKPESNRNRQSRKQSEPTEPETTEPIKPKTGDSANPGFYLVGTVLSLGAILLLLYLIRSRKE